MCNKAFQSIARWVLVISFVSVSVSGLAQDKDENASLRSMIASDGTGSIIIEAHGKLPELPVLFSASSTANADVSLDRIDQTIKLNLKVIQGDAKTLSLGILGDGEVTNVQAENLLSWSVRKKDSLRFLDLNLSEGTTKLSATVKLQSKIQPKQFPQAVALMHLSPGSSIGFNSIVNLRYDKSINVVITKVEGFAPLEEPLEAKSNRKEYRFQTATGGRITCED